MDNGRRLAHGTVDWRDHVQMRRDYNGRGMRLRLELARRHGILRRRRGLLVGVPLLHGLHVLWIAVRRAILLKMVVGRGIGVMVDGRVCLWGDVVVVVLLLGLPPPRHIRAGHHEGWARCCLDSRRRLGSKRPTCEATGRERLAGAKAMGTRERV